MTRILIAALAAATCLSGAARAQSVAITNAHIYSMGPAGEIASGTVVISGGRIVSVGAGAAPAGAQVIDVHGQIVTPGLIASNVALATADVSEGVESTNDEATASDRLSAAFDIQYAINPDNILIPIVRLGGVTDAVVTPDYPHDRNRRNMLFAGQAAAIHLGSGMDLLRKGHAGMVLVMGEDGAKLAGGSRAAEWVLLRAMVDDVRDYARNKAAYDRNQSRSLNLSREDLEALIPVVEGREPLVVTVHRAADILRVLQFAREEKLRLILESAEEGWMVAPQIAASGAPVLLNAGADLPASFEQLGSTLENAGRLDAAGVLVGIEDPPIQQGGRSPRIDAGRAVAHGLPFEKGLAGITVNLAKIWGLNDVGSLAPGKDADLVVWSGDPLEPLSAPVAVLVKGVQMPLRDRDLDLRDRYLKPKTGYPAQYGQ
jgi:imidazolonepropionase-like amidohydrolase